MNNEVSHIDCFLNILPYLQNFFDDDISIAITDREKFIQCYAERSLKVIVAPGTPIPEGGASIEVLRTGKPTIKDVPAHVYGIPFRSYAVPVKDSKGDVIGTVLIARSLELSNKVKKITTNVNQNATFLHDYIARIMEQMPELVKLNETIYCKAEEIKEKSEDTKKILMSMKNIARQSNLLALNASIEAARVGTHGKGFTVVAKQMGELSKSTDTSITMAKDIISGSTEPVQDINMKIQKSNHFFEQQSFYIKSIETTIQNITKEMQELVDVIKQL